MSYTRLINRSIMVLMAMILAIAGAGSATAVAQTQVDTDFSGGIRDGTEVVPPDDLALSREFDLSEEFDGTALPAGWEMSAWPSGG
ncbi:MAG: hypothetical protein ACRDPL_15775, partial [Propionibacteriaceae bacterium]